MVAPDVVQAWKEGKYSSERINLELDSFDHPPDTRITSLACHDDTLVLGFENGSIGIFHLIDGRLRHKLPTSTNSLAKNSLTAVEKLQLFSQGKKLVSAGPANILRVWSVTEGSLEHVLEGHSAPISALYASGQGIISGSDGDMCANVWRRGACVKSFYPCEGIRAILTLPGMLVTAVDAGLKIWDSKSAQVSHQVRPRGCFRGMVLTADRKHVLVASTGKSSQGIVSVIDTSEWKITQVLEEDTSSTSGNSRTSKSKTKCRHFAQFRNIYADKHKLVTTGLTPDHSQGDITIWTSTPDMYRPLYQLHGSHVVETGLLHVDATQLVVADAMATSILRCVFGMV